MKFFSALRFLTIIRLPGMPEDIDPVQLGRSTGYFPLIGLLIGLILALVCWGLAYLIPQSVVNALLIVLLVVLTGGMHIDGFIDSCDGIGGQKTAEERWRVMHDSRVGAVGVTGAVLVLLVKYAALNSLPPAFIVPTLIITPVVSRWAMVYGLFAYPYARPTGMGKVFKEGTRWPGFLVATGLALALTMLVLDWTEVRFFYLHALVILFVVLMATAMLANYLKKKFAGLTGDSYGAINEVAEVFVLLLVSLLTYNYWFDYLF